MRRYQRASWGQSPNVTVLWRLETGVRYRRSQQGLCKGPRNDSDEKKVPWTHARAEGIVRNVKYSFLFCTIATGSNIIRSMIYSYTRLEKQRAKRISKLKRRKRDSQGIIIAPNPWGTRSGTIQAPLCTGPVWVLMI